LVEESGQLSLLLGGFLLSSISALKSFVRLVVFDVFIINGESLINLGPKSRFIFATIGRSVKEQRDEC
jgi:hypothetical protein